VLGAEAHFEVQDLQDVWLWCNKVSVASLQIRVISYVTVLCREALVSYGI
jgi:hypothetical protein